VGGAPGLGPKAREAISDPSTAVFVSAASAWEIAIKRAKGTLEGPEDVRPAIETSGFTELPIGVGHALAAGALPAHHRDPFDRMLVAQARLESMALVTADAVIGQYEVEIMPAGR